jgi:3-hydroxyisobutyrate dehydrogenase
MTRIGFIGVGGIGRPMAQRLIDSGFNVTVCDRSEAALAAFRGGRASLAVHVSDCAAVDVIVVMVANDEQVQQVVSDIHGVLASPREMRRPRVIVMSSVSPQTIRELGARLRKQEIAVVEAPVSGGVVRAAKGTLTVMTAGDPTDIEAVQPVLTALAQHQFYCGALGSAETVKILNNIIGIANTFLMVEVSRIAMALGIDLPWLASVMEASSGRNYATRDYGEQQQFYAATGRDLPTMKAIVDVCRKDLALGAALAQKANVSTPLLDAIAQANRAVSYEEFLKDWQSL